MTLLLLKICGWDFPTLCQPGESIPCCCHIIKVPLLALFRDLTTHRKIRYENYLLPNALTNETEMFIWMKEIIITYYDSLWVSASYFLQYQCVTASRLWPFFIFNKTWVGQTFSLTNLAEIIFAPFKYANDIQQEFKMTITMIDPNCCLFAFESLESKNRITLTLLRLVILWEWVIIVRLYKIFELLLRGFAIFFSQFWYVK